MRPFRESFAFFNPVVLFTRVLPTLPRSVDFNILRCGLPTLGLERLTEPDCDQRGLFSLVTKAYFDGKPVFACEGILRSLL